MENINIENFLEEADETQLTELIEKANQKKRKSLDRRVAELENWKKQIGVEIKILRNDNTELKGKYDNLKNKNKKLTEQYTELENDNKELKQEHSDLTKNFNDLKDDTTKVTDTLIIHGTERRELEKYIHSLVYKEIGKDTLRDQLFHGLLTSKCKHHLSDSLTVASFNWIYVKDVAVAKTLSMKYLNKTTIHNLMQEKAIKIQKDFDKLDKSKNKKLTDKQIKQKNILELLIEECEGDVYEI
jgi:hypothetical protein